MQGTVTARSQGFVVTLVLKDAAGRSAGDRVVRVDRQACTEIATPASVVLAMMIAVARPRVAPHDEPQPQTETPVPPDHASSAAPVPEASTPDHASPAPQAPDAPPAVRATTAMPPSPERPPPHRVSFGAVGVASIGVLPGAGLGVGLRASYVPRAMVLLGLEATFETGGAERAAGGEVGFQLFSAAARAGLPVARTPRFELIPTVAARVGLIRTVPTDFAAGQNDTRVIPSVGPGVLARAQLSPSVFLEGLLDVELILLRDRFHVVEGDKLHRIHQPSALAGRLSMGLAYEFR